LFNLYYCYSKLGDQQNAQRMLQLMTPNTRWHLYPKSRQPDSAARLQTNGGQRHHQYEKVYLSFIEGRFDEALAEKKVADSLYGDKYWTPQLLYIESVYLSEQTRTRSKINPHQHHE